MSNDRVVAARQGILNAQQTDDPIGAMLPADANTFRLQLRAALRERAKKIVKKRHTIPDESGPTKGANEEPGTSPTGGGSGYGGGGTSNNGLLSPGRGGIGGNQWSGLPGGDWGPVDPWLVPHLRDKINTGN